MTDDAIITLADGTVISTRTGRPVRSDAATPPGYIAVPTNAEAVREVVRVRRRLADLPEPPQRMNVISCVAAYYLYGLDDVEIAHAIGCTLGQVGVLKTTQAFTELVEAMQRSIVETQQDDVRAMLNAGARQAADTVMEMLASNDDKVALIAAKDVLDRAGHRPVDVVEHRHRVEGGLVIEYVKRGEHDADVPALDLQAEEANDGDSR